MKKILFVSILVFSLTACSNPAIPSPDSLPAATQPPSSQAGDASQQTDGEDTDDLQEITPFQLTDEEQRLFDTYVKDLDVSIFKDAPPITVAKVFIQCGITSNIPAEYRLYAPEGLLDTEEDYVRINTVDSTPLPAEERQRFANMLFGTLDQGDFVETDSSHGYIAFQNYLGEEGEFNMIMDADGIWRVNYNILG